MPKEKIREAAIKFHFKLFEYSYDIIATGKSHGTIIQLMAKLGLKRTDRVNEIQGFITTNDRFVDRYEALKIAEENNQIKFKHNPTDILLSEDLRGK